MAMKKHHKILVGSFSSLVIIFMIASAGFMYYFFIKQTSSYNSLDTRISVLQGDINTLSDNLIKTQDDLQKTASSLNIKIGSFQEELQKEISQLKASVSSDFSGIIEDVTKSIVTVKTNSGLGTGFAVSSNEESSYIVTNAHVLADSFGNLASGLRVITYDKDTINAEFVGFDGEIDVAILKIPRGLDVLNLADSDSVQIGGRVIAIGNPLGLEFSVSEGIVSAIHRQVQGSTGRYIQTDTALNPGNSGGPLINKQGEVIGINNFKVGEAEGLGFALETDYIKKGINRISQEELGEDLV